MIENSIRERVDALDRQIRALGADIGQAAHWQRAAALRGAPEFGDLAAQLRLRDRLERRRAMLLEAYRGE